MGKTIIVSDFHCDSTEINLNIQNVYYILLHTTTTLPHNTNYESLVVGYTTTEHNIA